MSKIVDKMVINIVDDFVDDFVDDIMNDIVCNSENHVTMKSTYKTEDRNKTIDDPDSIIVIHEDDKNDDKAEDEEQKINILGEVVIGARRKLIERDRWAFENLNIDKQPTLTSFEYSLIILAELFILISATIRLVLLNSSFGRQEELEEIHTLTRVLYEIDHDPSSISFEDLKRTHITLSAITSLILLPNMFLLGLHPKAHFSLIIQFLISIGAFVITSYNVKVLVGLSSQYEKGFNTSNSSNSCSQRHSCIHATSSWVLYVTIIMFIVTTFLRLIFKTRFKSWIVDLKCIGRFVRFSISKIGRDILSLSMLIFLAISVISGSVIISRRTIISIKNQTEVDLYLTVETVGSIVVAVWLILLVWIHFQVHYRFTKSSNENKGALDEALKLADLNRYVPNDSEVSKFAYCPITKNTVKPVCSGQRITEYNNDL